jgi:endonuclease/exonuclease/phosphatase (EEP) superfamily protein YafD
VTRQATTADPRRPESYWRRLSIALLSAAAVAVGLFTIAGFAARSHWRLEQLCHFRVQYFWLLAAAGMLLLLLRKWWRAALIALLAAVNLATIVPLYLPEMPAEPRQKLPSASGTFRLRVMTFNVRTSNQHFDDVVAYLRDQQADVVIVLEVDDRWSEALYKLQQQFPHQHHEPRPDNFGIAMLSRLPWRQIETVTFEKYGVPSLLARFEQDGAQWTIIGTHPVPPGSKATSRARDEQLIALATLARRETAPVILAGDLNVTSWSPFFGDLLRDANLRDSRQGRGVQPSWVSRIPLTNLPLDHILVSPGIVVRERSVGPDLGSDHRPVVADLRLPKQ